MASIASMTVPRDEAVTRSADNELPRERTARVWILIATILASSMAFIDSTVVNVALPAIQASFHATVVDVQWVVESYGLFLGALILVGGSLGDLLGRRLVFLAGVAIFAIASAGCGVASSIHQFNHCQEHSGRGSGAFLCRAAWRLSAHLLTKEPWPGDRDVVGFFRDHRRHWAGSRRMAGGACFMALGIFYQPSAWRRR